MATALGATLDPLAGVEGWGWVPFGAAVGAFAGGPAAVGGGAVVGAAGQGEVVDVGVAVVVPVGDGVVGLGVVAGGGAAGAGAAAVAVEQHDALGGGGEAFGASEVERFVGVLVVDGEVVVGGGGHADEVGHG